MPFVASGSYGCVFYPHLKCKGKKHYGDGVGKIFYVNEDFESEKDIEKRIQKIDAQNKFTLPLYDTCETDKNYRPSDQIKKCTNMDMAGKSYNQLIYKYGGKSLIEVLTEKKGTSAMFKKVFVSLVNVLEGIQRVNEMGYVHQDIKPDNIMMGTSLKSKSEDKKAYIIDFGILDVKESIYTNDNIAILKYDYPYFPPEYKIFAMVNNSTFNKFYDSYMSNFNFGFMFNDRRQFIGNYLNDFGLDIKSVLKDLYKSPAYDVNKIDVYSFGIILLMVYLWAPPPKKHQTDVKTYIASLIHPDPRQRSTPEKALEMHKDIMIKFYGQ